MLVPCENKHYTSVRDLPPPTRGGHGLVRDEN